MYYAVKFKFCPLIFDFPRLLEICFDYLLKITLF